jgi:hypothetical protein
MRSATFETGLSLFLFTGADRVFEQISGIVQLISRSQGRLRRLSAVETKCPGDKVGSLYL